MTNQTDLVSKTRFIFKSFCGKTMFFELLHAKPFRTTVKLHQKVSFGSETRKIGPTVGTWRETLRGNNLF